MRCSHSAENESNSFWCPHARPRQKKHILELPTDVMLLIMEACEDEGYHLALSYPQIMCLRNDSFHYVVHNNVGGNHYGETELKCLLMAMDINPLLAEQIEYVKLEYSCKWPWVKEQKAIRHFSSTDSAMWSRLRKKCGMSDLQECFEVMAGMLLVSAPNLKEFEIDIDPDESMDLSHWTTVFKKVFMTIRKQERSLVNFTIVFDQIHWWRLNCTCNEFHRIGHPTLPFLSWMSAVPSNAVELNAPQCAIYHLQEWRTILPLGPQAKHLRIYPSKCNYPHYLEDPHLYKYMLSHFKVLTSFYYEFTPSSIEVRHKGLQILKEGLEPFKNTLKSLRLVYSGFLNTKFYPWGSLRAFKQLKRLEISSVLLRREGDYRIRRRAAKPQPPPRPLISLLPASLHTLILLTHKKTPSMKEIADALKSSKGGDFPDLRHVTENFNQDNQRRTWSEFEGEELDTVTETFRELEIDFFTGIWQYSRQNKIQPKSRGMPDMDPLLYCMGECGR
ncbi:hypothetical protein BS50DRAFT_654405 [Corynespora cassiicola Philippines]|uniref:Uncharacterized protein n=1 Tax=Corynespora cassiicola Philippines TaxID=1448308 RepID=A0A2T2P7U9_CORCC|nr:hypothetical protein BS50DRAFT_654405 [Corynespora cassiicola Philippines]